MFAVGAGVLGDRCLMIVAGLFQPAGHRSQIEGAAGTVQLGDGRFSFGLRDGRFVQFVAQHLCGVQGTLLLIEEQPGCVDVGDGFVEL